MSYLIETTVLDRSYYFTVCTGEMTFSADRNDAVQFAREQDAGTMLDHTFFRGTTVRTVPWDPTAEMLLPARRPMNIMYPGEPRI
jgi:hypothetical protein